MLARFTKPIILVGGGEVTPLFLQKYASRGYRLIGVDKGADHIQDLGLTPSHIIGDLDSVHSINGWLHKTSIHRIEEQDTTDFEKALYSFAAPLFLAFGFTGRRMDHTLAAFNAAVKYSDRNNIILCNRHDITLIERGNSTFNVEKDMIFSIFPSHSISFESSTGLKYPLDNLKMEIGGMIGTSNRTINKIVKIKTAKGDNSPYGVILPTKCLDDQISRFLSSSALNN